MTVSVVPEPGPERERFVDAQLETARREYVDGATERASETLVDAIRAGLWSQSRLWAELVSVAGRPLGYPLVRSLWLASPRRCHRRTSIMAAVARAAAHAGEHDEARAMLRKAIVREGYRRRQPRTLFGRHIRRAARRARASRSRRTAALADLGLAMNGIGARPFLMSETLRRFAHRSSLAFRSDILKVGFLGVEVPLGTLGLALSEAPAFSLEHIDFHCQQALVRHRNQICIDLRPHRVGDDGDVWLDASDVRRRHRGLELAPLPVPSVPCFVPHPIEQYLDESYPNWRSVPPDVDLRLDAPNAQVIDQDLFDTGSYLSLLNALTSGPRALCQRYVRILQAQGEGDWLDRLRIS